MRSNRDNDNLPVIDDTRFDDDDYKYHKPRVLAHVKKANQVKPRDLTTMNPKCKALFFQYRAAVAETADLTDSFMKLGEGATLHLYPTPDWSRETVMNNELDTLTNRLEKECSFKL